VPIAINVGRNAAAVSVTCGPAAGLTAGDVHMAGKTIAKTGSHPITVGLPKTPRRRIYDLRLGMSLVAQGVTELATVNLKDFEGIGFQRVWNPLG
jgi:hypothetical protein